MVAWAVTQSVGTRFERLVDIMRTCGPRTGARGIANRRPASLRPFVLEETYEVLEAIESGTPAQLCEELGDFLFEAVFLAQMSEENGDFTIGDAIDAICDKLVRRHPHVFARGDGDTPLTSNQVIEKWETLKAREREAAGLPAKKQKTTLGGVPKTLPSLLRAYEVSARAAAVGFDWAKAGDVLDKIEEEVAEVRHEVESGATGHCRAPRKRWAICCSRSPISRASSASSLRPRFVAPTRSSRRDSMRSSVPVRRGDQSARRRSRRWKRSGSG